ncbi:MAG: hypothetical protein EOR30_29650 [Mesorhizobium sp.]|uniref:SPW repeat domain-containing protein n=1 Tax=unclassified Mesorhizobium TaxID=325217 RepID=UPI000FCCBB99|nr:MULTISPECIES: SPW repeat protein [unclassified Mesorhizobium]RUV66630.1 hypothetical protein EOA78_33500 [Mesorhizobium sp. M5C.F.Cr.IN.023.01.1.1]RWF88703.1 MAG: hypothetical protein EOQ36_07730 [Mesorhizobium sp.]RWF92907.1 MAG: hypothetical protein EOQ45_19000 [Mesorhizobium sp.]RWI41228.1 MAG: hypothetical protein EOR14_09130 [Mesorhizobium sp.]RWI49777.1 MAG: hypothetical protein EOR15_12250 [Mesorhizobium sp.]
MQKKSWRGPFLRAMIALWVLISPWVLVHLEMGPPSQSQINGGTLLNFLVVGVVMMVISIAPFTVSAAWEGRVNAAIGIWLVASPWILGFQSLILTLNAVVVGILTLGVTVSPGAAAGNQQ